ncbi:MAG: hypothetical protein ACR2RL_12725, partial [Gammaproteobacteria bacterium]
MRQVQPAQQPSLAPVIRSPSNGLRLAMDLRIPVRRERFVFELDSHTAMRAHAVEWILDGAPCVGVATWPPYFAGWSYDGDGGGDRSHERHDGEHAD